MVDGSTKHLQLLGDLANMESLVIHQWLRGTTKVRLVRRMYWKDKGHQSRSRQAAIGSKQYAMG